MKYVIIIDEKFFDLGKSEIDSIIDNDIKFIKLTNRFFLLECNQRLPKDARFSFIEGVVPVEKIDANISDYIKISESLRHLLNKDENFRLEALNLNIHNEDRAKDIEVKIGTILEKQGYIANLKNPAINLYLFLSRQGVFIGALPHSEAIIANQFRFLKKSIISRAQFKLEEALNFFKINDLKIVLDVGAAPGGWSFAMLSRGAKVIAIDNALLNYTALLNSSQRKCIIFSAQDSFFDDYTKAHAKIFPLETIYSINLSALDFDLCYIKQDINKVDIKKLNIKFDAILIDMNTESSKSAEEACQLSSLLNDNGILFMAIKLIDDRISKHIEDAKNILSNCYEDIKIKRLPHNKKEVMLFAKLKQNKIIK